MVMIDRHEDRWLSLGPPKEHVCKQVWEWTHMWWSTERYWKKVSDDRRG